MNLKYMLDTNIVSNLMKDPIGAVASRFEKVGESFVCCSIIVSSELRYGAAKKASESLYRHVDRVLSAIRIIPFTVPADEVYGTIRKQLAENGTPIGPNDLLIAAYAVSEGLVLVTDNEKEFGRVQNLSIENWIR